MKTQVKQKVLLKYLILFSVFTVTFSHVPTSFSETSSSNGKVKPAEHLVISGKVEDSHGKPIQEATITVFVDNVEYINGAEGIGIETSNQGTFYLDLPLKKGDVYDSAIELRISKSSFKTIDHYRIKDVQLAGRSSDEKPRYLFEKSFQMTHEAGSAYIISAIILLLVYVFIAFDIIHRTLAAMLGATLLLFISYTVGTFFPDYFVLSFENAIGYIDFNVVFLLMGMMIIVGIMKETGIFQWLAYKSFQYSKGSVFGLTIILMVVTAVTSAFLDNVTTMLLLTPVTIEIALVIGVNPVSLLIPLVLASNIGGTATLIGDPPNIMIGSYAHLSFNDFFLQLTPVVLIVFAVQIIMMKVIYGKEYEKGRVVDVKKLTERLAKEYKIRDKRLLVISGIVLLGVIILFVAHGVLHMEPGIAAITGAAFLLLFSGVNIVHPLEKDVEWSTLIFFMMLFIIVGACEETGLIQTIADFVQEASKGNLVIGIILVLWVSAITSALIDNIPFTATMLPVVAHLTGTMPGTDATILWWALALGACFGGNGTLIGASANVVTAGLSEKAGYPIRFLEFSKVGVPVMLMSLVIATLWLIFVEM